jgi:hypothetical protein
MLTTISDHLTPFVKIKMKHKQKKTTDIHSRDFTQAKLTLLRTSLKNNPITINSTNANGAYEEFNHNFKVRLDKYCPIKTKTFNKKQNPIEPLGY